MALHVVVTGVAGFLGSHVAEAFVAAGGQVAGIDNMLGGAKENVPDGVEFLVADCLDRDAYAGLLQGADVVYHCAAAPYEGLSVFSPFVVHQHTAAATAAVTTAAVAAGVGRFVLCSSMARYGAARPPFTEDLPTAPVDPYGVAKVSAEMFVRTVCDIHGVDWTIAVPHNIIGPRQKFDDPYRNVASIMINRMLRGRPPVIYGDGSQRRCFSYVADVVDPLVRLGTVPAAVGEVVNVGPDAEYVTILELAGTIAELLGARFEPIFVPARPHEVPEANCSADKARRLLGYRPEWSLRDGLAEMIRWIEAVGPREFSYHLPLEIVSAQTPATWTERLL
jgi:UDP-glucose 4-epimerase